MTAASEYFHLDVSTDGGSFVEAHRWDVTNMNDNTWNHETVDTIDVTNVSSIEVRFECEGSGNRDRVFIDDIAFEGMV